MKYDIADFDVIAFLQDRGIQFDTEGKNISAGWIGINCPFCSDPSNHCGINIESKIFTCWVCAEKGNAIKLVTELESCSYKEAINIMQDFGEHFTRQQDLPLLLSDGTGNRSQGVLPITSQDNLPKMHTKYLLFRKFSPEYLIHKYKIKAVHTIGRYRFRIIAPFFLRSELVTFTARDVTGRRSPPYLACPDKSSIVSIKKTLYNIDTVRKKALLVEGITDVWRIGDGSIANSGVTFTDEQVELLMEREVEEVIIVFDKGANRQADIYAEALATVIKRVRMVILADGDPAEQPPEIIEEIRRLIR